MELIKGGDFIQKSTLNRGFKNRVSDFYIGKYEVTYDLWFRVRIWSEKRGYSYLSKGFEAGVGEEGTSPGENKYAPVGGVTWIDSVVWCNAYSEYSNLVPVYYTDNLVLKGGADIMMLDEIEVKSTPGYRLPTESEWHYAASNRGDSDPRAISGDSQPFNSSLEGFKYAWYSANSKREAHRVGELLPNELGIYDMSGNMWEWCYDWIGPYPDKWESNLPYVGSKGELKVKRGGGFLSFKSNIQLGNRGGFKPDSANKYYGFRVVRSSI